MDIYYFTLCLMVGIIIGIIIHPKSKEQKNILKRKKTPIERDIARAIGYFYKKDERKEELEKVNISFLSFDNGILTLVVSRPGILIGRKGENIDALRKYLREGDFTKDVKISSINIIESDIEYDIYLPWRDFSDDY